MNNSFEEEPGCLRASGKVTASLLVTLAIALYRSCAPPQPPSEGFKIEMWVDEVGTRHLEGRLSETLDADDGVRDVLTEDSGSITIYDRYTQGLNNFIECEATTNDGQVHPGFVEFGEQLNQDSAPDLVQVTGTLREHLAGKSPAVKRLVCLAVEELPS